MSRWIDADKRITAQLYDDEHEEWSEKNMTIAEYLDRYTEEGCPSADRPLRHGKWENGIDNTEYKACSLCGWVHGVLSYGNNYCPNCGAKMDKDSSDEKASY